MRCLVACDLFRASAARRNTCTVAGTFRKRNSKCGEHDGTLLTSSTYSASSSSSSKTTPISTPSARTISPSRSLRPRLVSTEPFTRTSPPVIMTFAWPPVLAEPFSFMKVSRRMNSVPLASSVRFIERVHCVHVARGRARLRPNSGSGLGAMNDAMFILPRIMLVDGRSEEMSSGAIQNNFEMDNFFFSVFTDPSFRQVMHKCQAVTLVALPVPPLSVKCLITASNISWFVLRHPKIATAMRLAASNEYHCVDTSSMVQSHRLRRQTPKHLPTMSGPGLTDVYAQIRHSILYLLWALVYLFLVLVQQPLIYFVVRTLDRLSLRWPFRGTRDGFVAALKGLLSRVSPSMARHFLSYTPFGRYEGNDRSLRPDEKKTLPLHSVSLNGCAWMLPYHIGVCEVLKQEKLVDDNTIWLGSSGGALIAAAASLDLDLEHQLKFCISTGLASSEHHVFGPVGNMSRYIAPHILSSLPEDAHIKASGKLKISITETPQEASVYGNRLVSQFKNRQFLNTMLMASTYIPIYYERPVRPGIGKFYWDGGFSNNQPVLYDDDGRCLTTTVCPMARLADISPRRQTTCNIEHLFPGGYDDAMNVYNSGRADALRYARQIKESLGKVVTAVA